MSKIKHIFMLVFIFGSIGFGCSDGDPIVRDARRIADLQCRSIQLMQKACSGDMSLLQESASLSMKATELASELQKKYTAESDKQLLAQRIMDEMTDCE